MSAHPEDLVESVTGIDVSLAIAGPGARALAFLVDWHIRLILALAWFASAALLYNGRLSLHAPAAVDARWFGGVVLPAVALYLLYHPILELALRGSTPGKRWAGVRIVASSGAAPAVGSLLVRNVFRLIDSLPVCYGVGLIAVMTTRQHVRIGDMAAGTLLVYERTETRAPAPLAVVGAGAGLDAVGAEIVSELLERWATLAPTARVQLAQRVLARYGAPESSAAASEALLREQLERLARPVSGTSP